ncbi:sigma-54-dependent Fis family transcriptional regulator [Gordonia hydrophobica]|uniref:Helix-turn-helix domain-containing protein n=1 Tax=Gordonia hydrophobica TaxID=40516 RepID=A0ABZ2U0B1_9ACTN|nr:helix-turn-helix domain-containing protein [Gordonia hydrophobica]MBM7366944.1 transcriptional regulator of acetoin/glycerol metabolism [Gordonia hydrophobica]
MPGSGDAYRRREREGSAADVFGQFRPEIEQSWRRCQAIGVEAGDSDLAYLQETPIDTKLTRAAAPVLDRLAQDLSDAPVTVLLADQDATIVDRRTGQVPLLTWLDRAQVAPGFRFAEQFAGTNGIGTALEERTIFRVRGPEHMLEALQPLACAGSPIVDPASRTVAGVLDITCKMEDVSDLMGPLIRAAVRDIEARLFEESSITEQRVLREYMRSKRRGHQAVVAMTPDTVIATPVASRLIDSTDQMMLWEWVSERLVGREDWVGAVRLSGGAQVAVRARRVSAPSEPLNVVVECRPIPTAPAVPLVSSSARKPASSISADLPRLAGRSPATERLRRQIDDVSATVGPVLISGDRGSGKAFVADLIQHGWGRDADVVTVDGPALTQQRVERLGERLSSGVGVIIKHLDEVPAGLASAVRSLLDIADRESAALVATAALAGLGRKDDGLADYFGRRIRVAPLRERTEDLGDLVRELLTRRVHGRAVPHLQPATHRVLVAHDWPGNIRELDALLGTALISSMGFDIRLEDLPDEYRSIAPGRTMTPLERGEREAIMRALEESVGNKSLAADRLGIARSTLYRKIRALGLENHRYAG